MSPISASTSAKNVLITGVGGIGGALAHKCLEQGSEKVFCVDREKKHLDALGKGDARLVSIEADVATDAGLDAIAAAVGEAHLDWIFLGAATSANMGEQCSMGSGHPLMDLTREGLDDMMGTDVHGKLFMIQKLKANIHSAAGPKCRIFNLGAPFGDGPMPTGKFMAIPGWIGFGAAKAATRYLWEGLKVECADLALFGYGHPGFTKTSLTSELADYKEGMLLQKMFTNRVAAGDFHTPAEAAELFYCVLSATSDEDFQNETWNIVKTSSTFPELLKEGKIKEISDMKGGIKIPPAK